MNFLKKNKTLLIVIAVVIIVIYFVLPMVMEHFESGQVTGKVSNDITKSQPALVLFHMNGCPHCKNLVENEWSTVKTNLNNKVNVKMIEASEISDEQAKLHDIKGFPTVKYCPNGLLNKPFIEHEGERKAEAIVKFVEKQLKQQTNI